MLERESDRFIMAVCRRIMDVAAHQIARANRVPQRVEALPRIPIYGGIFSEDEAESLLGGYRAFALSGFEVVFIEPKLHDLGYAPAGLYAGGSNQGEIQLAVSRRDFVDLSRVWMEEWRRNSPRRVEIVRQWLERFWSILVHETRHAFDSTSSEDKNRENKRAVVADRQLAAAKGLPKSDPKAQAAYRSYLRAPHEISARFSAAIAAMQKTAPTGWEQWRDEFVRHFQGYDLLPQKERRRLVARMYQVWRASSG